MLHTFALNKSMHTTTLKPDRKQEEVIHILKLAEHLYTNTNKRMNKRTQNEVKWKCQRAYACVYAFLSFTNLYIVNPNKRTQKTNLRMYAHKHREKERSVFTYTDARHAGRQLFNLLHLRHRFSRFFFSCARVFVFSSFHMLRVFFSRKLLLLLSFVRWTCKICF